jgi:CubicO group peptidase (beta-lactamase class C family)
MLLNKGQLDGVRILSRKTVELMTTDQVGPLNAQFGFGLGVSVTRNLSQSGELGSVGAFGWGGFWYTTFFVDPAEQMIGICMGQLHPEGQAAVNKRFSSLAYQAIMD